MKLILASLLFISFLNASEQKQPSLDELQRMVNQIKDAYGIIDNEESIKKYDIKKQVTEEELKKQVEKMQRLLKENPELNYKYSE